MRLIFVRHGDPDYSIDSLTEKGWREAEALSERVKNWKMDEIYASPMGRAQDTARVALSKTGRENEVITHDWLQEFYYRIKDEFTGEDRIMWDFMPDYYAKKEDLRDRNNWYKTPLMASGDVEKYYNFVTSNLDKLLEEHGYKREEGGYYSVEKHSDDTLVFFCHFGITAFLVGYLTGISAPNLWQGFFMAPTSVTVVNTEERQEGIASFRVQYFGDVSHLRDAGEPISDAGYFAPGFQE